MYGTQGRHTYKTAVRGGSGPLTPPMVPPLLIGAYRLRSVKGAPAGGIRGVKRGVGGSTTL